MRATGSEKIHANSRITSSELITNLIIEETGSMYTQETSTTETDTMENVLKKSATKNKLCPCIIKLTELSNMEWEKWLSSQSSTDNSMNVSSDSTSVSGVHYNMRACPISTRRKRPMLITMNMVQRITQMTLT